MKPEPRDERALDALLSEPRVQTRDALARVPGDIIVLGAGGKMGPTLAMMAARAAPERRVIAVSRFSSAGTEAALTAAGVIPIRCDLLNRRAVAALPDAPNVIFMAGQKFGTSDDPKRTWQLNVEVPAICAERYDDSRIVAFSTGNVYPLVPVASGGAKETDKVGPVGDYAESCVGRERTFGDASRERGTKVVLMRLNYAIDLRYGVLTDLALKVRDGVPIPLAMGHVNVIWQRDANRAALELLPHATYPPVTINVTGTRTLSVRELAAALGTRLGREPRFEGTEAPDALLSDASRMKALLGEPEMALDAMLDLVAGWVRDGKPLLGKPTKFEKRDGTF